MFLLPRKRDDGSFQWSTRIHISSGRPPSQYRSNFDKYYTSYCGRYYTYHNHHSSPRKASSPWFIVSDHITEEYKSIPFCKNCLAKMNKRAQPRKKNTVEAVVIPRLNHSLVRKQLVTEES